MEPRKVRVNCTLSGNKGEFFQKGQIFESPNIPEILLNEIKVKAGTVEVLEFVKAKVPSTDLTKTPTLEPIKI
jgi:hypothetical protein